MSKRNKIIYWIATIWLAFGMVVTGGFQLAHTEQEIDLMNRIGYPVYFLTLIGIWKMLGAIAILVPRFGLLKEWAYAGFFFAMSGAIFSHVAAGSAPVEMVGPALLITLTVTSWYFRPAEKKVVPAA